MKFPRIAARLSQIIRARVASTRPPDFVIGAASPGGAYLNRWYLTPWRRAQTRARERAMTSPTLVNRFVAGALNLLPNLYLHEFLRDDDDRALHDHPSWAASFMLSGSYVEHTIAGGGIHVRKRHDAGALRFMRTTHTHRIELLPTWWMTDDFDAACDVFLDQPTSKAPCWTLFLFGPTVRACGFHCPQQGWIPWQEFTAAGSPGETGPGCDA